MSKLLERMRRLGGDAALAKDDEAIKRLTGLQDGQFATHHTLRACDQ